MSKNIYDQLTPDEQKLVRDAAREVIIWGREQADKRHADRVAILKKNNVQIIKLDEKLLGEMQAKSKPVYDNISKAVGADLVKKLQDAVKEASK